jgi:oxygen-independent coproporphyrinogen-3 oxidase
VGFEHVSVDLIYGSQVETDVDLQLTLNEVGEADIDHVSAYSLIVESGTRLGTRVARGEVPPANDDTAAECYPVIDEFLSARGFQWYEVSNWAKEGGACKHNIAYWNNQDWLGIGPGAHAHSDGLRAWNIKHPAAWAMNVDQGHSPFAGSEVLDKDEQRHEDIMLQLRLRAGLSIDLLSRAGTEQALIAVNEGLLTYQDERFILTDSGRLLADGLVTRLWD